MKTRMRPARLAVVLLAALALIATACGADENDGPSAGGASATGESMTVDVVAGDLFFEPSSVEVPAGTELIINLTNEGEVPHDISDGTNGTALIDPGESESVDLGVMSESTVAWCTVPGHREAGMELEIIVTGSDAELASGESESAEHGESSTAPGAEIDFDAEPDADWQPFDPTLEPAPGGTEHELTLIASETVMEVAPGVTQEMWTFNEQVPGPILRGKIGDIFTITLRNEGELGHSIDFHASKVAWDDEMRTLQPGEELVYQFEAKHSGIFMYHCGTAPTLHHIGNGMHGAVIIDPPDLAPVDHEFVFVQSEIYTGPEGEPGDLDKMVNNEWDAVVFNGYVNQYLHAPIRVEPNERVRAWVIDNGPSENSSFHIVGTIFDTTYKEGTYMLRPDANRGGSQALDLQPAQAGFVEFTFDEAGLYPIVTHKFSNVGKGALGLFQAGDVPDREDDGVVTSSS